jgi:hypothetical protein
VCERDTSETPSPDGTVLSFCMECGRVKVPPGEWQGGAQVLRESALPLSHGYCPDCAVIVKSRLGLDDPQR